MDWSWAVGGITDEVPRVVGPECLNYLTHRRRIIESIIVTIICVTVIRWTYRRIEPVEVPKGPFPPHPPMRLLLLITMCFIFGVEFGFKFAGESMIYALNPCHVQTVMQIYLLAAHPSKFTISLFRVQMNYINGPFLASLFPETECRTFHFERCTYWIQHALLFIIPVYLLRSGAYKAEKLTDYYWTAMGVAIMYLYHFNFLTSMSVLTAVNLNHMLCAGIADPFQGDNYRVAAFIHETILCPILNKLTVLTFAPRVIKPIKHPAPFIWTQQKIQNHDSAESTILTTKID